MASATLAIVPDENPAHAPKMRNSFQAPELLVHPEQEGALVLRGNVPAHPEAAGFLERNPGDWQVNWDRRNDRPNLIQGSGVPLIPGRGNSLTLSKLGLAANETVDVAVVEAMLLDFIGKNGDLLKIKGMEFRLDPNSSVQDAEGAHWFIEFAQYQNGVRVKDANLFFRISNGNIIQFGNFLTSPVSVDTQPVSTRENALFVAWQEMDFTPGTSINEMVEPGELLLLPYAADNALPGQGYTGVDGKGYAHRLAWRYVFRVNDDVTTYEVLVDAKTNRVIQAHDLNVYAAATVDGGIFESVNTTPEVIKPMPFAAVTNGSAKVTDMLGMYDYAGGSATVTLDGQFFKMTDNCGSISLSNSTDGNLHLGTDTGTDCGNTSAPGGAGNTRSSRNGFYYLTRINRKAITYLPSNNWVKGKVTANMNVNDVCNAYWNGSTLNFFKHGQHPSVSTIWCSNTGELPGVFLHEWGHGMDTNSGGAANEYGTGEAVGDTFAVLDFHDACLGSGFWTQPDGGGSIDNRCVNCDNNCTGVRDVSSFSTLGSHTIAKPSKIIDNNGPDCDRYTYTNSSGTPVSCPYLKGGTTPYQGPMGYEGHCESYIASSANWDLSQSLVSTFGATQGWAAMDKIWYASLTPSKSAYQITSGGQCNVNAAIDGCGSNNWYTVYLAADDDDGNLSNGTPNACRIWDAFSAHGIACGTRPTCTLSGQPGFTLAATPATASVCAGSPGAFTVNVDKSGTYSGTVSLAASGNPAGSTATFSPQSISTFPGTSNLSISTTGVASGSYPISINGTGTNGAANQTAPITLNVTSGNPATSTLSAPANNATGVALSPGFSWSAASGATSYTLEVASDSGFATIVKSVPNLITTSTTVTGLAASTTYYWRVKAINGCGTTTSSVFSFTTGTAPTTFCSTSTSSIPDNAAAGVDNTITISDTRALTGLKVSVKATHPYVADLKFTLKKSTASSVIIDEPGYPGTAAGCDGDDYDVVLDDAAATQVENACNTTAPAVSGTQKPNNPVYTGQAWAAQSFAGTWTLNTADLGPADVGTLTQWCLIPQFAAATTYTVGGNVTGLAGTGLVLSLNSGAQTQPVSANGAFTFTNGLASGASYAVTVGTQPSGQSCTVSNGSGTIGSANVTNVAVNCTTTPVTFTVTPSVTGGNGTINPNTAQTVNSGATTTFTLTPSTGYHVATPVGGTCTAGTLSGNSYTTGAITASCTVVGSFAINTYNVTGTAGLNGAITPATQSVNHGNTASFSVTPSANYHVASVTGDTCTLTQGAGNTWTSNAITQACAVTATFAINSFNVTATAGANGAINPATQSVNYGSMASFTVSPSSGYKVASVTGDTCTVTQGAGNNWASNAITQACAVTATFVRNRHKVGGTVTGLIGNSVTLALNGTAQTLQVVANGSFQFPNDMDEGTSYAVTVGTHPTGPIETCSVSNGSGTLMGDVSNVQVTCEDVIFKHNFDQ